MPELTLIPMSEFERIRSLKVPEIVQASLFADCCRINTLYMIAYAGSGHIGTSFSCIDILSWLFLREMNMATDGTSDDVYFSSKGHDAPAFYSVMIGMGILDPDSIHTLRRLGGLPGHPDVLTPCVVTNTGSLGMGISKAKGMAKAFRLLGETRNIYVLTGDGELQEGQIWESLVSAANDSLAEVIVIIDHNKVQSDILVSDTSDLGDIESKFKAFGWHTARCDGHDFRALAEVLGRLKKIKDKPKVCIADTIKGKGVSFMEHVSMGDEQRLYRFHSGAPDYETYVRAVREILYRVNARLQEEGAAEIKIKSPEAPLRSSLTNPQRLVASYEKALMQQAGNRDDLVVLDADLRLDCGLLEFEKRFPKRFFECGIAEQDMVSQAGGMALQGLLPIVHSFACFLSTRPNEHIYNNASEGTKIIYVGSLAGVLPGGPGHSHQSVRDISALAAIPHLLLIEPCCEVEVGLALDFCVNHNKSSSYIRLVSIPCEISYILPDDYKMEPGKGVNLVEGDDVVFFGYGPILLEQAVRAASKLKEDHGVGAKVVNMPWLNMVDDEWLGKTVEGVRLIILMDNHYVKGGQGEMISARLAQLGCKSFISLIGVTDIPLCGQNDEILKKYGLDFNSITDVVLDEFKSILLS